MNLFVYGTLMQSDVVAAVTGTSFASKPARLPGYRRISLAGHYPYIVAEDDAFVDGLLLLDVDAAALAKLDAYEDEGVLYVRRTVSVLVDGQPHACQTYVGNPDTVSALRYS